MGKLLLTTLAGIYAVMAIAGRDVPGNVEQASAATSNDTVQVSRAANDNQELSASEAPQIVAKAAASQTNTPKVEKASLITRITPNTRMPGPELKPSPEYRDTSAPKVEGGTLWSVTANALNVRSGPSTSNAAIDRVRKGDEVLVVAESSGWAHVKIEGDGTEGWVSKKYLRPAN
ncbi:SH3 domain-containing protein [Thioclava sp. ES.031]|uniref:SH3 domain-containing protein n=1 Tax=Thioclava sp. ES.031 TaxID=1798203 RepID=UPI000C0024C3|nr:SH3 domain-containing protein [Thioclava sp. ES.031]PFG64897.1 SH3 domain-containing protein [Thioclava sp. ES.031]